jgi:hypothetical protein
MTQMHVPNDVVEKGHKNIHTVSLGTMTQDYVQFRAVTHSIFLIGNNYLVLLRQMSHYCFLLLSSLKRPLCYIKVLRSVSHT